MNEKKLFESLIEDLSYKPQETIATFEAYYDLLLDANQKVNLISRKTDPDKIWTIHFYDSLLPMLYNIEFKGKKVLDFGTGGGLPGIPLAIMYPSLEMHLLDARKNKIDVLRAIIKKLDLNNCYALCNSVEEIVKSPVKNEFLKSFNYDIIVCRSVAMSQMLLNSLMSLLNKNGFLLFYKAKKIENDVLKLNTRIYDDIQLPWGERKIVIVKRNESAGHRRR